MQLGQHGREVVATADIPAGTLLKTDTLDVVEVDYDYDSCVPVLTGCTADIAEYIDSDECGRTHRTWMLLTPAAVAATIIGSATPADEI